MAKFTLATLATSSGPQAAVGIGEKFYLLSEISEEFHGATVKTVLEDWSHSFSTLQNLVNNLSSQTLEKIHGFPTNEVNLLTPNIWPNKLVCVGANYADHLREVGLKPEKWDPMPFFMCPPSTSMVGPGKTVIIPKMTQQFDWELELTMVIGKRIRNASEEEASQAIAGFTIGLDLSCRDLIQIDNELKVDLVRGKAQDTMKPCGPVIVPIDFMPDLKNLKLVLHVNEKKMMDSSTSQMLFSCEEILATVSKFVTLEPGDMVLTGSPAGSAIAHGGCWLKPGDVINAEIEGIGSLVVQMTTS